MAGKGKNSKTPTGAVFKNSSFILLIGLILLITYISFSPVLKNGLVNWDDNAYIFENPHLNKSFTEAINYFFRPNYFVGNYIPLTMLVYSMIYHLANQETSFYHGINLVLHLMNVILVFWFIYLLSSKKVPVAVFVATLFAIHPMHVESVAWASELKDMLYALFFLAGLITYYRYIHTTTPAIKPLGRYKLLALCFVLFVLSILSKPAAIIFPLCLFLIDFYLNRAFNKWQWLEKLPFFALSVVFGIIAIKAQEADSLLRNTYSVSQKIFFASHSILCYLQKFVWPVNLSIFYPYPTLSNNGLPTSYLIAPVVLAFLLYFVYKTLKHTRLIFFGFLFFLTNLLLVLQFVSIGDAIIAERYTYISYLGLFFIVGVGFDKIYNNEIKKLNPYKTSLLTLVGILAIGCAYLTHSRCKIWRNDESIANDLLSKFPDDWLALNNKGFILHTQGNYQEAIKLITKAIKVKPNYKMARVNLVNAYTSLGDYDNALSQIDSAIKYDPQNINLINRKGNIFFFKKDYSSALSMHNKARALKKEHIDAYIYLSECYYFLNDYDKSMLTLDEGLKYEPDNFILLNSKGYILYLQKKYPEAISYYKASLKVKPDYKTAQINLTDCEKAIANPVSN